MAYRPLLDKVCQVFVERFEYQPKVSIAPGRVNLIGEHVDYNDGFVLPMAIDRYVATAMGQSHSGKNWRFYAVDLDEYLESDDLDSIPLEGWKAYVVGMVLGLRQKGYLMESIDLVFSGNVPLGSGMSSSAALELSLVIGFDEQFNFGMSRVEMALLAQYVEHEYAGVKCGIMDQYASVFGRKGSALLVDCKSLTHEYIPLQMDGYSVLLCNTGVSHALASSAYNERRRVCEDGLKAIQEIHPGISTYREVDFSILSSVKSSMNEGDFAKCAYVVKEMQRVQMAVKALKTDDFYSLGLLLFESHHGLSQEYEVSCKELDFLVNLSKEFPGIIGARMMGGGFGGCTINLIKEETSEAFISMATERYRHAFDIDLATYLVQSSDGAQSWTNPNLAGPAPQQR